MDLALPRLVESRRLPERVVEALSRLAPDRLPVRPGRTLRLDTGRSPVVLPPSCRWLTCVARSTFLLDSHISWWLHVHQ